MKKKLATIMEMLRSDRFSEVNAGLNRVKGMLEEEGNVFGKYQPNVKDVYAKLRMYDATRFQMCNLLAEISAHVGKDGKVHCNCGCAGKCGDNCKCHKNS